MRYVVQPGDTKTLVAGRFGVPVGALGAFNPDLHGSETLIPGHILHVPVVAAQPPSGSAEYVAQPGDTLTTVARRFGIELAALRSVNHHLPGQGAIFPGEIMYIPRPELDYEACRSVSLHPPGPGGRARGNVAVCHFERRVIVTALGLPEPGAFGASCVEYRGWLLDLSKHRLLPVKLERDRLSGAWSGSAAFAPLGPAGYDEAVVTPESGDSTIPTGPAVLKGDVRVAFPE